MASEFEEKETYLYLDFDGKIDMETIEKSRPFFRLAGLETANPVVQLNDFIFRGKYNDCVGTNLFFTEEENLHTEADTNCFKNETPIALKLLLPQTKILEMKPVKVHVKEQHTGQNMNLNVNFDQDYNITLKKLASNSLNFEDLIVASDNEEKQKQQEQDAHIIEAREETTENAINVHAVKGVDEEDKIEDQYIPLREKYDILEKQLDQMQLPKAFEHPVLIEKYKYLQKLARMPVRREVEQEPVEDCEERYKKNFEFHNIERQVFQRSDSFPILDFNIDNKTLNNAVDIDRCVLHGLIKASKKRHKEFTIEDKQKLLCIENFEFLSLPARLSVLKQELEYLEKYVNSASRHDLEKVDEYKRTPVDTLNILRKLVLNLENYLHTLKTSL